MPLGRLNHVGVATPSIEQSLHLYKTMFGAQPMGNHSTFQRRACASASSTRPIRKSS